MAQWQLKAPRGVAAVGRRGQVSPSISIALSQRVSSTVPWQLEIFARVGGATYRLGAVRTAPPTSARSGARVVALASCPGADRWRIVASPLGAYAPGTGAVLSVERCPDPGALGLLPLDGSLVVSGGVTNDAGAYRHSAGTGNGVATIPAGATVQSYTALAAAAATTIDVVSPIFGALPTITVPAGSMFGANAPGLVGPCTITFAGAPASRFVSWRELVG